MYRLTQHYVFVLFIYDIFPPSDKTNSVLEELKNATGGCYHKKINRKLLVLAPNQLRVVHTKRPTLYRYPGWQNNTIKAMTGKHPPSRAESKRSFLPPRNTNEMPTSTPSNKTALLGYLYKDLQRLRKRSLTSSFSGSTAIPRLTQ